ncbi:MAG: no significant y [Clostridiaceae bacterium]|jgi:hypothetical protein|nr:no significant y [Clostridiaceae bacterium]
MSLFLGKIHIWLFNKIVWFESLEENIIKLAEEKHLPVEQWKSEIYSDFGQPTEKKPLDEIIDTSNIHGWLQKTIKSAELRQAAWVTLILNKNNNYIDDLIKMFKDQGEKQGQQYKEHKTPELPEEIYSAINDYILEGMPCDNVNRIINSDENEIQWYARTCLHTEFWERVKGDAANFYNLREAWIKAFVEALNCKFTFIKIEERKYKIQVKGL